MEIEKVDRFELEAQIMEAWSTLEDIKTITHSLNNSSESWTMQRVDSVLLGLSILHDARCERLLKTFETLVASGAIK